MQRSQLTVATWAKKVLLATGLETFALRSNEGAVADIALSQNGHRLAAASETGIRVWNAAPIRTEEAGEPVVRRGFLGLTLVDRDGSVLVAEVRPNSSAASAGIMAGDQILAIGEGDVTSAQYVVQTIHQAKPGDVVTISVRRQGKEREVVVKLDAFTDQPQSPNVDGR